MTQPHHPSIREIARAVEGWAPPGSAQSYDNVGLQIGDAGRSVSRAIIALDATPAVLSEAREVRAELVLTHHPLLFRPLRTLTAGGGASGLALRFAEAGIALYSAHTNLDAAPGGVSFALARQLGLRDVRLLDPFPETLYKLAAFVPASHFEAVRAAIAGAGAGRIGEYDACAFAVEGRGFFQPGEAASPYIGQAGGELESVEELRLEVEVARWDLERVVAAMRSAHPYDEVAYDVYPVMQPNSRAGFGAVGTLEEAMSLGTFLDHICDRLGATGLRFVGDPDANVVKVAVCGGAGSGLTRRALGAGADAFITADISYHTFFDVLDGEGGARVALIDAGHYETEAVTEELLQEWLQERFPAVEWRRTSQRTSPVRTFHPPRG